MALGSAAGCCGFVEMCKFNLAPDNILFIGNWNQFYTSCEQNMQKVGCSSTEGVETMTLSLLVLFVVGCGVGLATIYAQPLKKWALKKHKVKTDR
jgi:H+/gluconate symporter-like permease